MPADPDTLNHEPTTMNARPFHLASALLAIGLTASLPACRIAPLAPIPEPLTEAGAWAATTEGGAFLGLRTEENDSRSLDALFFEPGVRVVRVVENSPADRAGVRIEDVVLEWDGAVLEAPEDIDARLAELAPGTAIELTVQRDDAVFTVPIALDAREGEGGESARFAYRFDRSRTRAAWVSAEGGAMLLSAAPDGPVARAQLEPGTVVIAVDGEPVASAEAMLRRLRARAPGERVSFDVRTADDGDEPARSVEIRLQEQPTRLTGFDIPILFELDRDPSGDGVRVEFLDFWLFALFRYERVNEERTWTLLELFEVSTGTGDLGA